MSASTTIGAPESERGPRPAGPGSPRRADIQGLRAVAVLMVVAFHAGLDVPGGFVGVDVFFVISGFVITAMLAREFEATSRIGFARFYKRRFQRLTPALAMMIVVTLVIGVLLLSPFGPLQDAAKTGLGAMLLVANFVIAKTTGGYFDAPAETNPLLHTWSLSVEEQFYLVFPLILFGGWVLAARHRRLRRAPLLLVGALAIASFGAAMASARGLTSGHWLVGGFYTSAGRAWEFAAGALLAMLVHRLPRASRRVTTTTALVGAAMLLASLWLIDGRTPFPGPWTLLPVVGTVLVLAAGTIGENPVGAALSVRPMVAIGDLSYSIYLWHWPFIVFFTLIWPGSTAVRVLAAALSLLPAVLSYRRLEQPIRSRTTRTRSQFTALVAVVTVPAIVVSAGALVLANRVIKPAFESGTLAAKYHGAVGWENQGEVAPRSYECPTAELRARRAVIEGVGSRCRQSKPDGPIELAIVGDSHAEQLFIGLGEALPDMNVMYYAANAFPTDDDPSFAALFDYLEASPDVRTVLLSTYSQRPIPIEQFSRSIGRLQRSGKEVFVTDDVPNFSFDPFRCKYTVLFATRCTESTRAIDARRADFLRSLETLTQQVPEVGILRTARYFCDADTCSMTRGRDLLFRDPNHLNFRGSRYLAPRLLRDEALRASLSTP